MDIVGRIDPDVPFPAVCRNFGIHFPAVRGREDKLMIVQVLCREVFLPPDKYTLAGLVMDFRRDFRSDDGDLSLCPDQQ